MDTCGRLCFKRRRINLSLVFAGRDVGVREVSDRIRLVSSMQYGLGYFDAETRADRVPLRAKGATSALGLHRRFTTVTEAREQFCPVPRLEIDGPEFEVTLLEQQIERAPDGLEQVIARRVGLLVDCPQVVPDQAPIPLSQLPRNPDRLD